MYTKEEVIAIVEGYIDDRNLHQDFSEWLGEKHNVTAAELGFEGI